ncbi:amylo-alpha-1,6-glucosidase [Alicyclobacillus sp. ALC3]|uniref:amylo-alpha-1,6-glucosidase n=1 Tax=Alicyclobacillus sp. ALC3 TaxID=2796143 RepID=UPI0023792704|nr:glycogen debranching N-terminal domain-containing protein [Alicyclobacillus sp. ALC3]WDL98172.1 amylo-alpha-1,6-glucosidase [Alicyclobacillus sp. ALC3]
MNFHVIKENDLFFLSNLSGESPLTSTNESGLFTKDTRFLSKLMWTPKPSSFVLLEASCTEGYECVYRYTNLPPLDSFGLPRESLLVTRRQYVTGESLFEEGCVENYSLQPLHMGAKYTVDADFVDMFEVRGFQPSFARNVRVEIAERVCSFTYVARDGRVNRTTVEFESLTDDCEVSSWASGDGETERTLEMAWQIPPRRQVRWRLRIRPEVLEDTPAQSPTSTVTENVLGGNCKRSPSQPEQTGLNSLEQVRESLRESYRDWFSLMPRVSGNLPFRDWYEQGLRDIRMLATDLGYGHFLVAGLPWYAVPFGRDSLIAARQMLLASPEIARGTVRTLGHFQGAQLDPSRDEEPGKIVHEVRDGELSRLGIMPFARYFGSIDSTPLYLGLFADYVRWTGDEEFLREELPHAMRALQWIEDFGDRDADGFLEYWSEAQNGVANQGWKDSGDSIMHTDGTLAQGPIALAEVQAYLHRVYVEWSRLLLHLGELDQAEALCSKADRLSQSFVEHFYLPETQTIAMALDGEKKPVAVSSSNMGQVLCSDILPVDIARRVAKRMMQPDMFSGYGIRTLSSLERAYNPISYHNGSVWPHDTALVMSGLRRQMAFDSVSEIVSGLLRAQAGFGHRLPELFAGLSSEEVRSPVPYPVSCSPQAWAAAVPVFTLEQLLGLDVDVFRGRILLDPFLPEGINELNVEAVPIGMGQLGVKMRRVGNRTEFEVMSNSTGLAIDVGIEVAQPSLHRRG